MDMVIAGFFVDDNEWAEAAVWITLIIVIGIVRGIRAWKNHYDTEED